MSEAVARDNRDPNEPWCLMTNGQVWRYNDTEPATPEQLLAMAEMLGKIARFNGATDGAPYSVAQHSLLVAALVPPDARPYALLHDFHESVLGDLITPAKAVMIETVLFPAERHVIARGIRMPRIQADQRTYSGAGLDPNQRARLDDVIRGADLRALEWEARSLFPDSRWKSDLLDELASFKLPDHSPLKQTIRPMPWDEATAALKVEMKRILPVFNEAASKKVKEPI